MKTLTFFLIATCCTLAGYCQQQAFTAASLESLNGRKTILFTVPREVNVRYYRVEASNDSMKFEVIATIRPQGNSQLARSYSFDLATWPYKYYRIGIVGMDASLPYSKVVGVKEALPDLQPALDRNPAYAPPAALAHQ